jgi:hypothetical protein
MDGIEVITKLQRLAKNQLENLTLSITSGNIDNMEKYQYMTRTNSCYTNIYYRNSLTC